MARQRMGVQVALAAMAGLGATAAQAQSVTIDWQSAGGVSAVPVGGGMMAALMALALLAVGMWVMRRSSPARRMLGVLAVVGALTGVAVERDAQAIPPEGSIQLNNAQKPHVQPFSPSEVFSFVVTNTTGLAITLTRVDVEFGQMELYRTKDAEEMPQCQVGLALAVNAKCRLYVSVS